MPLTNDEPVTQKYINQAMIAVLCNQEEILANGINSKTSIVMKFKNNNYNTYRQNRFKYNFMYNFLLSDFANSDSTNIKRVEVISHDEMSLNFGADLYSNTTTIGDLLNSPISANHSKQYPNGITLKQYLEVNVDILPKIVRACPVNIKDIQEYYPQSYFYEYQYMDLMGSVTMKTSSFTAIKYTTKGIQKVVLFGTGLQEPRKRNTGGTRRNQKRR